MFKIIKKERNLYEQLIYSTNTKELIALPIKNSDITFSFICFLVLILKIWNLLSYGGIITTVPGLRKT